MTNPVPRLAAHLGGAAHLSDEAVAAFADGVLREGARSRAEQHLSDCAECRGAVREQRQASSLLRSAPLPSVPLGLAERLRNLPGSTPLTPAFPMAALSPDHQPMFAAFHTQQASLVQSAAVAAAEPALQPHRPAVAPPHRRVLSSAGLGVFAATAVTVSILAAGTSSANTTRPRPAPSVRPPSSRVGPVGSTVPAPVYLDLLTGTR